MSYKLVTLGDVCTITGGGTPSKSNPSYYEGDIYWATVRDMSNDVLSETDFKISMDAVKESSTNIIPKGNVVIASRVGLGKVCILNQDTAINQDLRGVIPKNINQLDVKYLFYWFKSISQKIIDAGRGATVHGVTLPFIKSLEIPLPSLATQQKIVAKLDAIFAEIDKAILATEANVKNVEALFQSYLAQTFQNTSADWEQTTLDKVCRITNGSTPKRDNLKYWEEGTISWFTIEDIRRFGRVITETTQHVTQFALDDTSLKILPSNSVLLCCTASVGEYAIIKKEMATNQQFNGLTVTDKNLSPEFLFWYAATMKTMLLSVSGKVTIDFVPISKLKSLQIKFPCFKRQLEIVDILNRINCEVKKINGKYIRKKDEISSLKQLILKQAFNGELVKD